MTNEEIWAFQAEYKRFVATPAGKSLHAFRNALIRETMDGERENVSMARLRDAETNTRQHWDALIAEIKRLQALEGIAS